MDYSDKLKDKRWIDFAHKIRKYRDFKCQVCDNRTELHVHHLEYIKNNGTLIEPWQYKIEEVVCLCKYCHEFYHKYDKYSNKNNFINGLKKSCSDGIGRPLRYYFEKFNLIPKDEFSDFINEQYVNTKIYLAGKIRQDRKRYGIVDWGDVDWGDVEWYENYGYKEVDVQISDNITMTYVGPYTISCDHGCYHSPFGHGNLGGYYGGCLGNGDEPLRKKVYDTCIKGIKECDLFILYIDSDDIYGSIYELGVAKSLNKKCVILTTEDFIKDKNKWWCDTWFMRQGVNIYVLNSENDIRQFLVEYGTGKLPSEYKDEDIVKYEEEEELKRIKEYDELPSLHICNGDDDDEYEF